MKKIIISVVCLFLLGNIYAQKNYKNYIKDVPGLDKYLNASAINVITDVTLNINVDKTYTYKVFYIKKILTYKGKKKYSDIKIPYDADYETVKLGDCFSVNKKGEKVPIPKEAFHNSETTASLLSPDYINDWEKILNMPGAEPNSFIVINYTKTNTRKDIISGVEQLMDENPYMEKNFTINCPKNLKIKFDYRKDLKNLSFKQKENKNIISYKWTIKNTKLIPDEQNAPSYFITGCPIVYSTAQNWENYASEKFVKFNKGIYPVKEIQDKARELTKVETTKKDKLFAIYKYIANNFTNKNAIINEQDFAPQALEKIFKQKFGSSRDLVALFISMAKAVGINNCYPAIILKQNEHYSSMQKNNVVRNFMDNIVVYWNKMLIYPGENYMPFAYAGVDNCNIVICKNKAVLTEYHYKKDILVNKNITCKLDKNKDATLDYNISYFGYNDYKYRGYFRNQTEQKRKILFSQIVHDKSSMITDGPYFDNIENLNKTLSIRYKAKANDFYIQQNDYIYFKLPGTSIPIKFGTKKRITPFLISHSFAIAENFTIEDIPSNYSIIKPDNNINKELKLNNYKSEYYLQVQKNPNGDITITRKIIIPQGLISPNDYKNLKEFISKLKQPQNLMVFFKKKP